MLTCIWRRCDAARRPLALAVVSLFPLSPPAADWQRQAQTIDAIPMTWRIERQVVAGEKTCALASWGDDVVARLTRQGRSVTWSVTVGVDNQPGSLRYLRINKRYFTNAKPSFSGAEAKEIVALLKGPGEFAFEWARRPDSAKQPGLYATGDFATKATACEGWVIGDKI